MDTQLPDSRKSRWNLLVYVSVFVFVIGLTVLGYVVYQYMRGSQTSILVDQDERFGASDSLDVARSTDDQLSGCDKLIADRPIGTEVNVSGVTQVSAKFCLVDPQSFASARNNHSVEFLIGFADQTGTLQTYKARVGDVMGNGDETKSSYCRPTSSTVDQIECSLIEPSDLAKLIEGHSDQVLIGDFLLAGDYDSGATRMIQSDPVKYEQLKVALLTGIDFPAPDNIVILLEQVEFGLLD